MSNDMPTIHADVDTVANALVIRVPFDLLAFATERAPFIHTVRDSESDPPEGRFKVTDPVAFARSVASTIMCEQGDGGSLMQDALDDAAEQAVEMALPGFDWPAAGLSSRKD